MAETCYHCSCWEDGASCCDCSANAALDELQREYDLLKSIHEQTKTHYIKRTEHLYDVNQTLRAAVRQFMRMEDLDLAELDPYLYELVHGEAPYSD